ASTSCDPPVASTLKEKLRMCGDDPRSSPVYHTCRPAVPDWAILGAMNAAYRQLLETFGQGWGAGDVDTILSVFAPDAVFLETPFSEQSVGIDAIRAYWKDIPTNQADVTFKSGEIYAAGPWFATEFRCTYRRVDLRSEEHTSELQSRFDLVCRLLLEKKNTINTTSTSSMIFSAASHSQRSHSCNQLRYLYTPLSSFKSTPSCGTWRGGRGAVCRAMWI